MHQCINQCISQYTRTLVSVSMHQLVYQLVHIQTINCSLPVSILNRLSILLTF